MRSDANSLSARLLHLFTPVCRRLVFGNAVPTHLVKYCIQPLRDRTF